MNNFSIDDSKSNLLYELLEIENTEEILDFSIPKYSFPLWLYIRFDFFQYLINLFTNKQAQTSSKATKETIDNTLRENYKQIFFHFLPQMLTPWPQRDIWYLSNIGSDYYKNSNGKLIDIYNDTFASVIPSKSLYISQSIHAKKDIQKETYPFKFIQSADITFGKLSKYLTNKQHKEIIHSLIFFLKSRCKSIYNLRLSEEYWHSIEKKISYKVGRSIAQFYFYQCLYRYRKPKILVLTDSYYGHADIISQAHAHDIITVEIQHGAVTHLHPAYNWAKALCESQAIKNYIVDYFLTFGSFWHNCMQLPGKYFEIGSPWFSNLQHCQHKKGEDILFCLAEAYNEFKDIIEAVQDALPSKKVIVRPHPHQKKLFYESSLVQCRNIIIDNNTDIYETFQQASIVIGDLSTSLYEALALGKRVFILKTDYSKNAFPDLPVTFFVNSADLIKKIKNCMTGRLSLLQRESIFNTNWQQNYKNFVDTITTRFQQNV